MIYGSPFDRERQVDRLLRRSRPGLVRGRSESAAPVSLPTGRARSRAVPTGSNGAPGAPGPDGTARLSRGYRMWARPIPTNSAATVPGIDQVRCTLTNAASAVPASALIVVPATTDLNGLPRFVAGPSSTSAGNSGSLITSDVFIPGSLSSHDGFSIVCQFAFTAVASTRRWFVGISDGITGDPSNSNFGILGVGQDAADTAPQFMHSDEFPGTGTTRFTTALPTVAADKIYEVRIYWAPGASSAQISFESFAGGVSSGIAAYDTGASVQVPSAGHSWLIYIGNGTGGTTNRFAWLGFFAELHPGTVI